MRVDEAQNRNRVGKGEDTGCLSDQGHGESSPNPDPDDMPHRNFDAGDGERTIPAGNVAVLEPRDGKPERDESYQDR